MNKNLDDLGREHKRPIYSSLADVTPADRRPIVVQDADVDVPAAAKSALRLLSANRKGYFLMIEWDAHTNNLPRGLDAVVGLDKLIREIASTVNLNDTLLLFTADHSFELRSVGGRRGRPLLDGLEEWKKTRKENEGIQIPALRVGRSHTGEEVVAAAQGPGAEQVRGFLPNTRLFQIMMNAFGWKPDPPTAK
jgi:alkaline phosphatase